jgi:hypothetical protein
VSDNVRRAALEMARELLDEAVSRLRGGYVSEVNQRGTELRIEIARAFLWLSQEERQRHGTVPAEMHRELLDLYAQRVGRGLIPRDRLVGSWVTAEPGEEP